MARIAGIDLPPSKAVEIGLTYIYGIGRTRSAFGARRGASSSVARDDGLLPLPNSHRSHLFMVCLSCS